MERRLSNNEIAHDFSPFFKVYKNGFIDRCVPIKKVSPYHELDPSVIRSKDVIISTELPVSARIFMPKEASNLTCKLPVLIYIHEGGFALRSAFDPVYHTYVASIAIEANVIAASIEYQLGPEHPIPACYDDSWEALQLVASHTNGNGPDRWLNTYGDFRQVFMAGDSAGPNISYNLAVRVGLGLSKMKLVGMVMMHPFFMGTKLDRVWLYLCPKNGGLEDSRLKPAVEDLARTGCERYVLVFVAGKDQLRNAGWSYCEELKRSGWKGSFEIVEHDGSRSRISFV